MKKFKVMFQQVIIKEVEVLAKNDKVANELVKSGWSIGAELVEKSDNIVLVIREVDENE
ncbi:hypothetical protein AB3N02_21815 [Priestia aryabhattai]|uniref:hypothetical protein n=1 Tax=Priestia aryabhattai TaxID=412384 RepID=UPI0039A18CCF